MRGKGKPAGRKAWYRGKRCREHETLFTLCPGICRREGSRGAGADIRDQGHAGGQRRVGKEEADREVAPVTAPAQLTGAAECRSVQ